MASQIRSHISASETSRVGFRQVKIKFQAPLKKSVISRTAQGEKIPSGSPRQTEFMSASLIPLDRLARKAFHLDFFFQIGNTKILVPGLLGGRDGGGGGD